MLFTARTSRSNDRNGKLIRQSGKCIICITGLYPIVIHACEENLSCSAFLGLFCPLEQVFICFDTSSIQVTFPTIFGLFGIYCQHTNLRTEILCNLVNQLRITDSGRIDRDLIRPCIQQAIYIT